MTTTIKSILWTAIVGGTVALTPAVVLADTATRPGGAEALETMPDHATAESHAGVRAPKAMPDHATAENDDARQVRYPTVVESNEPVPDHATAEARGAKP